MSYIPIRLADYFNLYTKVEEDYILKIFLIIFIYLHMFLKFHKNLFVLINKL